MTTYQQQLAKCKDTNDVYSNIWRRCVWTITDYEELFRDIDRGYIIQDPEDIYFIINPDWEEEDSDDSDDEDEDCVPDQELNVDVLNDIKFMTDFILTMTDETEKKSLSYCILDHIMDHDKAVYKKDQAWYRGSLET